MCDEDECAPAQTVGNIENGGRARLKSLPNADIIAWRDDNRVRIRCGVRGHDAAGNLTLDEHFGPAPARRDVFVLGSPNHGDVVWLAEDETAADSTCEAPLAAWHVRLDDDCVVTQPPMRIARIGCATHVTATSHGHQIMVLGHNDAHLTIHTSDSRVSERPTAISCEDGCQLSAACVDERCAAAAIDRNGTEWHDLTTNAADSARTWGTGLHRISLRAGDGLNWFVSWGIEGPSGEGPTTRYGRQTITDLESPGQAFIWELPEMEYREAWVEDPPFVVAHSIRGGKLLLLRLPDRVECIQGAFADEPSCQADERRDLIPTSAEKLHGLEVIDAIRIMLLEQQNDLLRLRMRKCQQP